MNKGAMSLKAQIRNLAKKKNVKPQILLQNYMFERFLERLSLSEYKNKFVIKGGMLIATIVGMDARSTMDLDATLRDLPLTEERIHGAISAICSFPIKDDVVLTIGSVTPIRSDDIYGGYRAKIKAVYETIEIPFALDVSTGDVITPQPVKYTLRGIFDEEKQIELWAYNIETVMAEKIETVLRRNILNTRPRDIYDIFILSTTQKYDISILKEAITATAAHRGTTEQIADFPAVLKMIAESAELGLMWEKYRREFDYAADISYEQTVEALKKVCAGLSN